MRLSEILSGVVCHDLYVVWGRHPPLGEGRKRYNTECRGVHTVCGAGLRILHMYMHEFLALWLWNLVRLRRRSSRAHVSSSYSIMPHFDRVLAWWGQAWHGVTCPLHCAHRNGSPSPSTPGRWRLLISLSSHGQYLFPSYSFLKTLS
eukprot:6470176-Amphidinium_carterae.4